jgi:DNA end-binding protein Ku
MAKRANWEGFLKLNLISVPVKAYTATAAGGGKIHFHQLHAACHSRIRYKKVCPVHGEVDKGEIVSGYEYAKGQYVVLSPEELKELLQDSDKAVTIDAFVRPAAIDPLYYSGRTYYLVPAGRAGDRPYAVLHRALGDQQLFGLARVVLGGKEQMALLRPLGKLLALTMLSYHSQIKQPAGFEGEVPETKVAPEELRLAETLIEASTVDDVDFTRYRDEYTERLIKVLEARAKGKRVVMAPAREEPVVINLMDALRQSLRQARGGQGRKKAGRRSPKREPAVEKAAHKAARRKTG